MTPTVTQFPVGEFIGGKVAYVSAGLGAVQSVVGAILTALTNSGPAPLISRGIQAPVLHGCAVSGTTSQDCALMGTGASKTIHLVLGANNCVTAGPWGGTAVYNGMITIDSMPFFTNTCGPPPFFASASYIVEGPPEMTEQGFVTILRDSLTNEKEYVTAQLNGVVSLSPAAGTACLINGITLSLNGVIASQHADGSVTGADFDEATVVMDQIIFNANCVPIFSRLKFSGDVRLRARDSGDFSSGLRAVLSNFFLTQDTTGNSTLSDLNGTLPTDCSGTVALEPITALSVAPGTLCPLTGQFSASGRGATAMVTYQDGQVVIEQAGAQRVYPDCRAEELHMCLPQ